MSNILEFKVEDNNTQHSGVLFSIIYLWYELKKMNMPQTTACVESAIDAFFDDLKNTKKINNDDIQLQKLLKKMLSLPAIEVTTFLSYIAKAEDGENL